MPIVNLNNLMKWIKKVCGRFMIHYFLIAILFVTTRFCITLYDDLLFFAKLLMNFVIGGFFCHGVLINMDLILGISQRFSKEHEADDNHRHSFESGCSICGDSSCIKGPYISQEPWSNLMIDCRLDYAIQKIFETVLNNFVLDWYLLHSNKCEFVDELKAVMKYSSSKLFRRIQNIHLGKLITHKLVPCGLRHFDIFYHLKRTSKYDEPLEDIVTRSSFVGKLHPAVLNRQSEFEYLRNVTSAIMPLLLPPQDLDNRIFGRFIRELFARWILLPLLDFLADPKIINTLLVLLTDGKKMIEIQKEPSVKTEFLHKFTRHGPNHRHRRKSLRITFRKIIKEPTHLYTFMQFMKNNSKVHILQFCLDVDGFNEKLLCPELSSDEKIDLYNKANGIYSTYFQIDSTSALNFPDDIVMEMHEILKGGSANIALLQTSQAIFEAYEYAYNLLKHEWAPKFYHSHEFYSAFLKKNESDLSQNLGNKSMSKMENKFKDKLKTTFNEQMLSIYEDLKMYLDPNKGVDDFGLSTMDITIQEIFHRLQADWVSDIIYVINIQSNYKGKICNWVVERKEDEFYVLQEKLIELYGDQFFKGLIFPSNRSNIPNDFIKIKFEKFLQYVIKHEMLCTDNLVCLFLTDGDVTFIKQRESYPLSKFGKKSQSPASKTQVQKFESLAPFLKSFFDSPDTDEEEEDDEDDQGSENENTDKTENLKEVWHVGKLSDSIFKNNFNIKQIDMNYTRVEEDKPKSFQDIKGFCDCMVYLLTTMFELPSYIRYIIWSIPRKFRMIIDTIFDSYINHYLCDVFCEARLAYLISIAHDLLFTDKSLSNKMTPDECMIKAKEQLHSCLPSYLLSFMGDSFLVPIDEAFELIQNPQLNKQLVISLFDILLCEIFPEIVDNDEH